MSFGKQIVGALKSLTAMWGFCISQFIVSVCATGVVVGMLYGTMQTRDGLAPELLEFIRSGGTADVNSAWLQRLSYVVLLISSLVTVLWLLTGYKRSLGYRGSQLGTGRITVLNILLAIFSGLSSMLTVQLFFHLAGFSNAALMTYDTALTPLGLVALVIAAPVTEELVFRGFVFRRMIDRGVSVALTVVLTGIAFGLVHGNAAQIFYALPMGLWLGYFRARYDNLWLCVIMHICANYAGTFPIAELGGGMMPLLFCAPAVFAVCAAVTFFTAKRPHTITSEDIDG